MCVTGFSGFPYESFVNLVKIGLVFLEREQSKRSQSPTQRTKASHSTLASSPSRQSSGKPAETSQLSTRINPARPKNELQQIIDPFRSLPMPVPRIGARDQKSPPKKYLAGVEFQNVMASVEMVRLRRQQEEIQAKAAGTGGSFGKKICYCERVIAHDIIYRRRI